MAEQHSSEELETQRVNDYLRSFKSPLPDDVSLENQLLEKAALELKTACRQLQQSLKHLEK